LFDWVVGGVLMMNNLSTKHSELSLGHGNLHIISTKSYMFIILHGSDFVSES
jgi:hypothetical protein